MIWLGGVKVEDSWTKPIGDNAFKDMAEFK